MYDWETERKFVDWVHSAINTYGIDSQYAKTAMIEYCKYKGHSPHDKTISDAFPMAVIGPDVVLDAPMPIIEVWYQYLQQFQRGEIRELPDVRWPVFRCPPEHQQIGSLPFEFDENNIRSKSIFYDARPGDIVRDTPNKRFLVNLMLGGGDLDCIVGFSRRKPQQ